jgi:hypothetical protein
MLLAIIITFLKYYFFGKTWRIIIYIFYLDYNYTYSLMTDNIWSNHKKRYYYIYIYIDYSKFWLSLFLHEVSHVRLWKAKLHVSWTNIRVWCFFNNIWVVVFLLYFLFVLIFALFFFLFSMWFTYEALK